MNTHAVAVRVDELFVTPITAAHLDGEALVDLAEHVVLAQRRCTSRCAVAPVVITQRGVLTLTTERALAKKEDDLHREAAQAGEPA